MTNVEKKMGLKVSTTCELTFGAGDVPAQGWLVGEVHDGIAQMFKVIEHARMFVGAKAIATLSAGYQVALDYAKNRVQGADLTATTKDAPRVTITHHPDVRRSLMLQKAYAEGMRALYLYTASFRDQVTEAEAAGKADSEQAKLAERVNDLLLPIVKGFGSERPPSCSPPSRCRPSAARATCRTTRSSSTSATPRSTPSTRAPRRSRARTSSSGRSSRTAGSR